MEFCMPAEMYVAFRGPDTILSSTILSCLATIWRISRKLPLLDDDFDS